MDKIRIERLECYGYHGVFPEENRLGQRFYIDVEMGLDLRPAGTEDDLTRSVNYADVCLLIQEIVELNRFQLIETVAETIASRVLDTYTIVEETTVRVTKPHPPVPVRFGGVSVEIHRRRDDR
ncbi:dihydroneopterin aldolase [Paenibacillus rubinfantis]|uniref:dihydroneopterin aldolase n=1 Tax=Paenibacillus rubinfantis TaxID=1720296 RepID=UPI00073E7142|nr:dihydroneopterin aldolase [Paenibacillus rubinfantis]